MRLFAVGGIALACFALVAIAAKVGFDRSHAADFQSHATISILALHTSYPNIGGLPVEEPPLP